MKRFHYWLIAAILLSSTVLIGISSCKKEEPEDPFVAVNMITKVSLPQALLNVADVTVMIRTSDNLVAETVDSPDWKFVLPLTGRSEITTTMPIRFDLSLKGKDVEKGEPVNAGVSVDLTFESEFGSGRTEPILHVEKKNSAQVIWISSEGRYGSLAPLQYYWRGDLKKDESSPAKYSIKSMTE